MVQLLVSKLPTLLICLWSSGFEHKTLKCSLQEINSNIIVWIIET